MADIKFSCPHCNRAIQCDELWGGHQIQCPVCQGEMTVPQLKPEPAPSLGKTLVPTPPAGSGKLSAGRTQVARSSTGTGASQKPFQPVAQKKSNPLLKFGLIGVLLVAIAGGGYFAVDYFGLLGGEPVVKPVPKKKAGGAPRGPLGEATGAMDASEALDGGGGGGTDAGSAPAKPAPRPAELPVIAPLYTLEVSKAKIPESKVNGIISTNKFVSDTARIDRGPTAYVLTLRQGAGTVPDAAVQVFLRLKPTDGPTNQSFTVSHENKDPVVSQVVKLWKDPRRGVQQKPVSLGFCLKLELAGITNGIIPGKIYLALPDDEQSVVAGVFNASLIIPDPNALPAPAPGPDPAAASAARNQMNRRYGTRQ
jgi:hypothetical protein